METDDTKRDAIQRLGPLAIASRLRRLSERLMKDGARIYRHRKFAFEPRWFPVFRALTDQSPMSVTELARRLRVTHPAINQAAGAMERAGLLISERDERDDRKRLLSLSPEGKELAGRLAPVWRDIEDAARELLTESRSDLISELDRIEAALDGKDMFERVAVQTKKRQSEAVTILEYEPRYKDHFRSLNLEWLTKYFSVEDNDERLLSDPEGQIMTPGGQVLFAAVDGEIVGTVALVRHDSSTFELTKLAVTERMQGVQAGKTLVLAAIERAKAAGASSIILHTSPKLVAANSLYENLGFVQIAPEQDEAPHYERPSITYKLRLS